MFTATSHFPCQWRPQGRVGHQRQLLLLFSVPLLTTGHPLITVSIAGSTQGPQPAIVGCCRLSVICIFPEAITPICAPNKKGEHNGEGKEGAALLTFKLACGNAGLLRLQLLFHSDIRIARTEMYVLSSCEEPYRRQQASSAEKKQESWANQEVCRQQCATCLV